jgi:hypothetical protein
MASLSLRLSIALALPREADNPLTIHYFAGFLTANYIRDNPFQTTAYNP